MAYLVMGVPTYAAVDPGSWDWVIDAAVAMDRAGVDRVVVPDHVVFGEHLEQYANPASGGRVGGQQPTGPDGYWLEPLTTLAVMAGRTSRIRLGTNILIAALRRPMVLAKVAATLDVLSGGRLDLGVGVSWQREEYGAAGLDFTQRGALLDETLEICRTLWTENPSRYRSDRVAFEGIHMMPKPGQSGGVPIWVSGSINPAVVRRLARFGTGWVPWAVEPADLGPAIARMKDELHGHGRSTDGLRVLGELPVVHTSDGRPDLDATMDQVPAWVRSGVTDFRVGWPSLEDLPDVVGRFRSVAGRSVESGQ